MSKYNKRIEENIKKYSKLNDLDLYLSAINDPKKYGITVGIQANLLKNSRKLMRLERDVFGNVSIVEKIIPYYDMLTILVFIKEREQLPDTFTNDEKSLFALESMKEITHDIAMAHFATKSQNFRHVRSSDKQMKDHKLNAKEVKREIENAMKELPVEWYISKEILDELKNQVKRLMKKQIEFLGEVLRINDTIVAAQVVRMAFCMARTNETNGINGADAKNKLALSITMRTVDESISELMKTVFQ